MPGRCYTTVTAAGGLPFFNPPGSIIYQTGFEEGTAGNDVSGGPISWTPNPNVAVTPHSANRYSASQAKAGLLSAEFFYSSNGLAGPCPAYLSELRFNFGANYREITWDCWMFTPTNFKHFLSGSSNNNKMFRFGPSANLDPASGPERFGASFERDNDNSSGCIGDWDENDGAGMTQRGTYSGGFNLNSEAGTWHEWTVYMKAPTSLGGTGRAYLKIWKDGTLKIDERPDIYFASSSHDIRHGYWLGAQNGWVNGATSWYMDSLTIWGNP